MKSNLDSLRTEIQEFLGSRGMVIFYSFPRVGEPNSEIYWDTAGHPDFHEFVAAAEAAGVRLVTLSSNQLEEELLDEALERLADANLDRDERRVMESRLKEIRGYAGFTCQIELAFDLASRTYILDLRTDWFDDLNDLIDGLDDSFEVEDEDDDDAPGGSGYFSRN
jgi:hypothetical protein